VAWIIGVYYSKYNIIVRLQNTPAAAIIHNLFHGRATLIDVGLAKRLERATKSQDLADISDAEMVMLKEKAFVYTDGAEEQRQVDETYLTFKSQFSTTNALRQYQLLMTYSCNLACGYCFQKNSHALGTMTLERLERALASIDKLEVMAKAACDELGIESRRPTLSVVGGEPLQYSDQSIRNIARVTEFARDRGMDYKFTSNGYDLARFVPLFVQWGYAPGEIQVTLDGVGSTHDRRRPHAEKKESFGNIVVGIDAAVKAGVRISLRVNVDKENIGCLPSMASFIEAHDWHKTGYFGAYAAPVTDHSGVNDDYAWLDSEANIYRKVLDECARYPEVRKHFQLKNFRGYEYVKSCVMADESPSPTFWRCEAVLGQVVFEPNGDVYSCFEAAGNARAKIGTFDPAFELLSGPGQEWANLDSINSPHCAGCRFAFVCAGGCPWHTLRSGETECMPIKQQVALAWNYFADLIVPGKTRQEPPAA
jgi:uncharacterized protein